MFVNIIIFILENSFCSLSSSILHLYTHSFEYFKTM